MDFDISPVGNLVGIKHKNCNNDYNAWGWVSFPYCACGANFPLSLIDKRDKINNVLQKYNIKNNSHKSYIHTIRFSVPNNNGDQ